MQKEGIVENKRAQFPFHEEEESPRKLKEKEKALKISVEEGAVSSVSSSVGDGFITPFAIALNAQPIHIGILSAISGFVSPIAQIFGTRMMEHRSRKSIVVRFVLLQALTWILPAILGILYYKGMFQSFSVYALIAIYSLIVIFGGLTSPGWFSWMGDIVPEEERGIYFGKRNRATGLVGLAAALIAAFVLDAFKTRGLALIGFSILFFCASLFRFLSFLYLTKQFSPKFKLSKKSYFSIFSFLRKMDNYGKFSIYMGVFNLALMIASPFFTVYMLKQLNYNYVIFIIVSTSSSVFYLFLQPLAGKFSDKFGNKMLLIIGNLAFAVYPIFWLFMKNPLWIILIPQLISGIANAAWTISTTNFIYDSSGPQKRGICLSYTNLIGGVGTLIGALLGGLLSSNTIIPGVNAFFVVFIISASLRLLTGIIFLPSIKEGYRRKLKRLPRVHISVFHPMQAVHKEAIWFKHVFR